MAVDGGTRFQRIDGFGSNVNSLSWNNGAVIPALDMLANDAGQTLWRVVFDNADWEATNDDADPNTYNWTYYNALYSNAKFQELWNTLAYLDSRGQTPGVVLNFMGPVPSWMGGSSITNENEWAEMMASLVYYAVTSRGLCFPLLAPLNESDLDGREGALADPSKVTRLLDALGRRLDALGLTGIRLVAPDAAHVLDDATTYLPALFANPYVMSKVAHLGFHDYYEVAVTPVVERIAGSGYPDRTLWITETDSFDSYLTHLRSGSSAEFFWEGYASVYNHAAGNTPPNDSAQVLLNYDATARTYAPTQHFYELAHLSKFVPVGSYRVGLSTPLDAVAFYDGVSGRLTIVGRNTGSATTINGSLRNLPAFTSMKLYETTAGANLVARPVIPMSGATFSAPVSASSIFTLTAVLDGGPPSDEDPPVRREGRPSGTLTAGTTTASVSLTTDEAATCRYSPLAGVAYGAMTAVFAVTGGTNHSLTATGLVDGAAYSYYVKCRDAAGNDNTDDYPIAFSVALADRTPPAIRALAAASVARNSATIAWTTDEAADTQVEYGTTTRYGTATTRNPTLTTAHTQSLTNLLASTVYHYRALSRDAAGNLAASPDATFTTLAGSDTTAPVRSNGSPTGTLPVGTVSVTVSLRTDEAATCRYATQSGISFSRMTAGFTSADGSVHSTAVNGLSGGRTYRYYARCMDRAGNANTTDYLITFAVASGLPTVSFRAMPSWIRRGQSSTLTWSTTGASAVTIAPGVGTIPLSGSTTVAPVTTTRYTLSATGAAGTVTKQVTVMVW